MIVLIIVMYFFKLILLPIPPRADLKLSAPVQSGRTSCHAESGREKTDSGRPAARKQLEFHHFTTTPFEHPPWPRDYHETI